VNADGINDAGQITGFGYTIDGAEHAFLLTPVPEPSSLVRAVLGGLVLLGYGGWRHWATTA
jgi:probable HAF family extracellular repeat protein